MMKKLTVRKILLIAFAIETICATYALKLKWLTDFTSIFYFLSGITIGCTLLFIPEKKEYPDLKIPRLQGDTVYRFVIMALMCWMMVHFAKTMFEDSPLNYKDVDMLPIIKTMCERFLSGKFRHVYDPIQEIWNGIKPIYLPAMWLPFCLPIAAGIDMRWITILVMFFSFSALTWLFVSTKKRIASSILVGVGFLLFWWLFTDESPGLIPSTEEGVIIGYYVFLALALFNRNYWHIGIATSLCVLSRYALIGWVPAMVVYLIFLEDKKQLFRYVATGIICFWLLVLIPFGWDTFKNLVQLPKEYIAFSGRVWHDSPKVFSESLGFAKFFGPNRILLQHNALLFLSFVVPITFMFFCLKLMKQNKKVLYHIPLACLKITLVFFYNFIDVPYLYLFYTSSFLSLVIVSVIIWADEKDNSLGSQLI